MLVAAECASEDTQFAEQGFFIARDGFSGADIAAMRGRLEAIVRGEFSRQGRRFQPDTDSGDYGEVEKIAIGYRGPDVAYRKIADLEYDEVLLRCLQSAWIESICTRLMQSETVSILRVTVMDKPARGGTPLPWHQDISLEWPTDRQPALALWFPLDAATVASGSLQVIPGSHKAGIIGRGHLLPTELEARYAPPGSIVTAEMQPGDCLFFHAALLHRSGVNASDAPRRAVNAVLMPGRAMHTRRGAPYPVLFGEGKLEPSQVEHLTKVPA